MPRSLRPPDAALPRGPRRGGEREGLARVGWLGNRERERERDIDRDRWIEIEREERKR